MGYYQGVQIVYGGELDVEKAKAALIENGFLLSDDDVTEWIFGEESNMFRWSLPDVGISAVEDGVAAFICHHKGGFAQGSGKGGLTGIVGPVAMRASDAMMAKMNNEMGSVLSRLGLDIPKFGYIAVCDFG